MSTEVGWTDGRLEKRYFHDIPHTHMPIKRALGCKISFDDDDDEDDDDERERERERELATRRELARAILVD